MNCLMHETISQIEGEFEKMEYFRFRNKSEKIFSCGHHKQIMDKCKDDVDKGLGIC